MYVGEKKGNRRTIWTFAAKRILNEVSYKIRKSVIRAIQPQLNKYGPQCFKQAENKCLQIEKGIVFKDFPDVQKMKFSRGWW